MQLPSKYYRNNLSNTLNLLDVMVRHDVGHFIFSSTAATFGEPDYTPIDEVHPQKPINPYGASKLMVERVLQDYAGAYGFNSVCLRYFNACGADPEGELGENHEPETHLIPLILQAASGRRQSITVYGTDYPTEDGTCIRDYIHIHDLCSAHLLAFNHVYSGVGAGALTFNLGNGKGFSVRQIIKAAQRIVAEDGCVIDVIEGERRAGDPAVLVADASCAKRVLGWQPEYADLETIIRHAWSWEKKLQQS
jgi:UDP-glucose 4-epimerase